MGKISKDIQKRLPSDFLQPGEQLVEASWLNRPDAGQHMKALLTTGRIPHLAATSNGPDGVTGQGLAAAIPGGTVIIALTDRRLLAFGPSAGRKDVLPLSASFAPEEVVELRYKMGISTSSFRASFADGSEAVFDLPRDNNAKGLGKAGPAFCRGTVVPAPQPPPPA